MQLTKDHVPVIYHDFLVSETGIDAPVHTLTLEQVSNQLHHHAERCTNALAQFLHVNDHRTPRTSRPPSPSHLSNPVINGLKGETRKQRSMSVDYSSKEETTDMSERMKHTRTFKEKGFKANSRGSFIQAPFTTLEEMFRKLPETIGFNIEMSMSALHLPV